jgi:predicted DNA-binding protein (MmcQ/YjbR family)
LNHEQIIKLGLRYDGTSLRYPFDPHMPVLFVHNKMFALLGEQQGVESVNLKTPPDEAWLLRETYPGTVIPGYHMNKKHWNTVILNGSVPNDVIESMVRESYLLVVAKLPKSVREEMMGN